MLLGVKLKVLYANVGRKDTDIQITNTIESVEVDENVRLLEKTIAKTVITQVIGPIPDLHESVITISSDKFKIMIKPKNSKDWSDAEYY